MKTIIVRIVAAGVFFCVLEHGSCETPEEGLKAYEAKIAKANPLGEEAFAIGQKTAHKHGTAIIRPILDRSSSWKDEEGLAYIAIVLNLPLHEAIKAFETILDSKDKDRALWAREFLIEIEMYSHDQHQSVENVLAKHPRFADGVSPQTLSKSAASKDPFFYFDEGYPRACLDVYKQSNLPADAYKGISVIGRVKHPGAFGWKDKTTLSEIIERAGGFDSFAESNHVGIWRNGKGTVSIVNALAIIAKAPGTYDGPLERGDVVIVLEKRIGKSK